MGQGAAEVLKAGSGDGVTGTAEVDVADDALRGERVDPGDGLQRRLRKHRHQAEQLGADPQRGPRSVVAPVGADGVERRIGPFEHGAGVGTAQQRLGGQVGRRTAQAAVAQQRIDAVARRGHRRRDPLESGEPGQGVGVRHSREA
jgi:hypothetical protein